jgi:hypothetical protein
VVEVGVVAQPRIERVMVGGVIAVRLGGEHGPQRDTGGPEFEGVVEPRGDPAKPVLVGRWDGVCGKGADEAQRIDLPPDLVLDPVGLTHGRNAVS